MQLLASDSNTVALRAYEDRMDRASRQEDSILREARNRMQDQEWMTDCVIDLADSNEEFHNLVARILISRQRAEYTDTYKLLSQLLLDAEEQMVASVRGGYEDE